MLLNEKIAILTPKVLLVPYSEHHVPTYHEWMQDEALQKATASDPLTLPQEHAMQRSWRLDADKLTFIACIAPLQKPQHVTPAQHDAPDRMLGDVNLFLCDAADDNDDEEAEDPKAETAVKERSIIGEIEIMIARKELQGSGYGKAVLLAFLAYIMLNIPAIVDEYSKGQLQGNEKTSKGGCRLKYLRVKVDGENAPSIRLFESVGFKKISETVNYFGELELRWDFQGRGVQEIEELRGVEMECLEYGSS
ncbi:uncharacterized protein BDZ99DRAFT_508898 [Mytilinidion resinicola]|uniref:N-acetyltransferase domain-containing protein n=1 Tax=Mytilinidion resinicola TaxID=574789 RepID=A0A6A6YNP5_9PEZI|nr:uncharacterized protein BDZ99DRAFT_508898 [Mytilinidion resinicola]KAF2810492.1 hypothetical protein BDZ99DRAFT_508898 [Mytilinidion resinicola]